MNFNVNEAPTDNTAGSITTFGAGTATKTSCVLSPAVSKAGILWWALTAAKSHHQSTDFSEANCSTQADIEKYAARPNTSDNDKTDDQKSNESKMKDDYLGQSTDPASGQSWAEFSRARYTAHKQTVYYGAINVYNTSSVGSINASWLWANTEYQICGFAENVFEQSSVGAVAYFTTTATDTAQSWTVGATGTSTTGVEDNVIRDNVSYAQGVNPQRNTGVTKTYTAPTTPIGNGRRLTTHTYSWTANLETDRSAESPSCSDIATLSTAQKDTITASLKTALGTNFTVVPYTNQSYTAP